MGWKHYQTVEINLSFEKKISLSKIAQKIIQKFTQNRLTVVNEMSIEI